MANAQMELIFADDPARVANLENELGRKRKQLVDFYIEVASPPKLAPWTGGKGTDAERLQAVRTFLMETRPAQV